MSVELKSKEYVVTNVERYNNYRGATVLKDAEVGDTIQFYTTIRDYSGASNGGYYAPTVNVRIVKPDTDLVIVNWGYQKDIKRVIDNSLTLVEKVN